MTDQEKNIERYTDSLYYELEQTTKFFRVFSMKFFKKMAVDISPDEFVTIETILCNAGICQRDLAKLILKDRANTGKILNTLEEKGYITRFVDMKNNRLVRKMGVTESGKQVYDLVTEKLRNTINKIGATKQHTPIPEEEKQMVRKTLRKFRENLSKIVDMQI